MPTPTATPNPPTTLQTAPATTAEQRLAEIAARLDPCPAPATIAGYDRCPCGRGSWPCGITEAAWIARKLDPYTQARAILDDQLTTGGWPALTTA
ncbi:hypothetical protein [Nocardia suismassiliense]|uniref:hypothetical protein n=1 Tax=Nocardia suismassiliense TaxID=2077092 RepID=UPI00131F1432|nr:hypothetical protein [Nocardia suismassiliense]